MFLALQWHLQQILRDTQNLFYLATEGCGLNPQVFKRPRFVNACKYNCNNLFLNTYSEMEGKIFTWDPCLYYTIRLPWPKDQPYTKHVWRVSRHPVYFTHYTYYDRRRHRRRVKMCPFPTHLQGNDAKNLKKF